MKYLAWILLGAFFLTAAILLYPNQKAATDSMQLTPDTVRQIMTQSGSPLGRSGEVAMLPNPFEPPPQQDGGAKPGQSICETWRGHYNPQTGFAPATIRQMALMDPGQRSVIVEAMETEALCRAVRENTLVPCTDLAKLFSPSDVNSCMFRAQILLGIIGYNSRDGLNIDQTVAMLERTYGGTVTALVRDVITAFAATTEQGCEDALGMRLGNTMLLACKAAVTGNYDACNGLTGVEDNLWCEQSARAIRAFRSKTPATEENKPASRRFIDNLITIFSAKELDCSQYIVPEIENRCSSLVKDEKQRRSK